MHVWLLAADWRLRSDVMTASHLQVPARQHLWLGECRHSRHAQAGPRRAVRLRGHQLRLVSTIARKGVLLEIALADKAMLSHSGVFTAAWQCSLGVPFF